jgi:tRNA-Thr(GGU) m(6)t(6)A37 methyltransferase TsaA
MRDLITRIVLHPELEPLLFGLTGFSHILVLYWPHLVPGRRRSLQKVHPMGCPDIPEQGIFATCSPARPNPVLVTACRLRGITGTTLEVQGLEAVDGSPVLDIKPYNPGYYRIEDPEVPEWMSSLYQRLEDDER